MRYGEVMAEHTSYFFWGKMLRGPSPALRQFINFAETFYEVDNENVTVHEVCAEQYLEL